MDSLPLPPIPIPRLKFQPIEPTKDYDKFRWEGGGNTLVLKYSTMALSKGEQEYDGWPYGVCVYGTVTKDKLAGSNPPENLGQAYGALVMEAGGTYRRFFERSFEVINDIQQAVPLQCEVRPCMRYRGDTGNRRLCLCLTYLPTDGFRPQILAQDGTELPQDFNLKGKDVKAVFSLVNYTWAEGRAMALAVVLSVQLL